MTIANILLVDDEIPFVKTLIKRLEKRKMRVCYVFSGNAAIDLLKKKNDVEVIILDVKMPGLNGIETLKEIKKNYPLIEVIMLTGYATVESAIEGMKLGAFDYLMKPFDMDIFLLKIKEAITKKRKHDEKIVSARLKEIANRRP